MRCAHSERLNQHTIFSNWNFYSLFLSAYDFAHLIYSISKAPPFYYQTPSRIGKKNFVEFFYASQHKS